MHSSSSLRENDIKELYRAVLVLGGLWLPACGSVSREDFDEKLAEALCERYVRCGMYLDEESCEREMAHRVIPSIRTRAEI